MCRRADLSLVSWDDVTQTAQSYWRIGINRDGEVKGLVH